MGARLTERNIYGVVYVGKHRKTPDMDAPGIMKVAASREVMARLAEYEDTGLTPEEVEAVKQQVTDALLRIVEAIAAIAPKLADTIQETLQHMPPEQIAELLQGNLLKN